LNIQTPRLRRALLMGFVGCGCAWPVPPAYAQEAARAHNIQESNSPTTLGEIVVTAQKREQSINDVGMSVTAVSAQQLLTQGVNSVADLTRVVPSFTVAPNSDGAPVYSIRGVGLNATNIGSLPTVTTYLDEAPLTIPAMTSGALFDLQRVEVLRGPQGTLFGQNSTGGAINFIANKPTSIFESGFNVSYSSFNDVRAEGYVSGPLTNQLNARLALVGERADGWQYNYVDRNETNGRVKKGAARLILDWRPTDRTKFSIDVNGWIDKSDPQEAQVSAILPAVPANVDPALVVFPLPPHSDRSASWDKGFPFIADKRFYQVALRSDIELNAYALLTTLTSYTNLSKRTAFDTDGTAIFISDTDDLAKADAIYQEVRVSGDLTAARLNYVVGASYEDISTYEVDTAKFGDYSAAPSVTAVETAREGHTNYATFANVDWGLSDHVTLTGGLRYTSSRHTFLGCSSGGDNDILTNIFAGISNSLRAAYGLGPSNAFVPGGCTTLGPAPTFLPVAPNLAFSENSVSWRAGVNWRPNKSTLFYVLLSRGYKSGGYPNVPSVTSDQLAPVKQEELTAYEIGTKLGLFDRTLQLNISAYHYNYVNKQLITYLVSPIFGPLQRLANIPTSEANGIELDATWQPVAGLTLRPSISYTASEIGNFVSYNIHGLPVSLKGVPFNFSPPLTIAFDGEYRRQLPNQMEVFLGATINYNDDTYADLAQDSLVKISAYTTVDARLGISNKARNWKMMIWGKNLGNEYYWTNAYPSPTDTVVKYTGQPRTWGVSLSHQF
jgi:iron complex outermembrane receptor protein